MVTVRRNNAGARATGEEYGAYLPEAKLTEIATLAAIDSMESERFVNHKTLVGSSIALLPVNGALGQCLGGNQFFSA